MRKQFGQIHSRESSATLQLTVSLLYPLFQVFIDFSILLNYYEYKKWVLLLSKVFRLEKGARFFFYFNDIIQIKFSIFCVSH